MSKSYSIRSCFGDKSDHLYFPDKFTGHEPPAGFYYPLGAELVKDAREHVQDIDYRYRPLFEFLIDQYEAGYRRTQTCLVGGKVDYALCIMDRRGLCRTCDRDMCEMGD